jgi:hypothetical protein
VPFAHVAPATAASITGTIVGALMLGALFFVLTRERVPAAAIWAVVPLLASSAFVYRFSLVRPHLLSIALALVVLWAASRERLRVLALASVVYPCSQSSPRSLAPSRAGGRGGGGPRSRSVRWPSESPSTRTPRTCSASTG